MLSLSIHRKPNPAEHDQPCTKKKSTYTQMRERQLRQANKVGTTPNGSSSIYSWLYYDKYIENQTCPAKRACNRITTIVQIVLLKVVFCSFPSHSLYLSCFTSLPRTRYSDPGSKASYYLPSSLPFFSLNFCRKNIQLYLHSSTPIELCLRRLRTLSSC